VQDVLPVAGAHVEEHAGMLRAQRRELGGWKIHHAFADDPVHER
jgi:hypothetical protein